MGSESALTRVPGYWADRHPVAVSIGLVVALVALVAVLGAVR